MKALVAVVDDHPLVRRGLAAALGETTDLVVAVEAGSALQAIELAHGISLDAAIVDILMPRTSGISLTIELAERHPHCRVLGLSAVDEPAVIADMLRAGACGFALKSQPMHEIVDALRQILDGARYLPPSISHDAIDAELATTPSRPLERMTHREREVFELVIRGMSNDEIATKLFISPRTAESHRHRIMKKLSSHSIPQLQRLAAVQSCDETE